MLRSRFFVLGAGAFLFLALALSIAGAASDEVKKNPPKPAAASAKQTAAPDAAAQGMRVFIDPATGQIREPEQTDIQGLAPATTRLRAAPASAPLSGPGGAVGMKVDDSQMIYSVATKNADGTVSFECVSGAASAAKAITGKPAERRSSDVK